MQTNARFKLYYNIISVHFLYFLVYFVVFLCARSMKIKLFYNIVIYSVVMHNIAYDLFSNVRLLKNYQNSFQRAYVPCNIKIKSPF